MILFTGHRIDAPDRLKPRFPPESEAEAQKAILKALADEGDRFGLTNLRAISSGASGGDILFLESCMALQIPAEIYLARQPEDFVRASVADSGSGWVRRFEALCARFPVHILDAAATSGMNDWQQTNHWMLDTALGHDGVGTTVIALWDGQDGDGDGGTQDMVDRARAAGARVIRIDTADLR
jgi:hypothetical protein